MKAAITLFIKDTSGATAIEYALIAALISIVCVGVWQGLGTSLNTTYSSVDAALQ
jgi:pilus assembly protein Flp/PilA